MKNKAIKTILAVAAIISSYLLGTMQVKTITVTKEVEKIVEVETIPVSYIDTTSDDFYNNYVDMRQVIDYSANENGLQLYMADGSGYWYEY